MLRQGVSAHTALVSPGHSSLQTGATLTAFIHLATNLLLKQFISGRVWAYQFHQNPLRAGVFIYKHLTVENIMTLSIKLVWCSSQMPEHHLMRKLASLLQECFPFYYHQGC